MSQGRLTPQTSPFHNQLTPPENLDHVNAIKYSGVETIKTNPGKHSLMIFLQIVSNQNSANVVLRQFQQHYFLLLHLETTCLYARFVGKMPLLNLRKFNRANFIT